MDNNEIELATKGFDEVYRIMYIDRRQFAAKIMRENKNWIYCRNSAGLETVINKSQIAEVVHIGLSRKAVI